MIKKINHILILTILFLYGCQNSCYSDFYQIKSVTELGNGVCEYHTWGIGTRFTWTELSTFNFQDECNLYDLSQILTKKELENKYGFRCK